MILGPKWIPETHIFRGGDKTHQDWEIVKNASKCGILICRKKALKEY